ncbi:MAG: hypothetical protein J7L77_02865, partial [Clostridiales bacterium]|nr:hypothetical protein [Clostridiales bacterium]
NLILYNNDEIVAYAISRLLTAKSIQGKLSEGKAEDYISEVVEALFEDENIDYIDYKIGIYRLSIGRAKDPLINIANANFLRTMNVLYLVTFFIAMLIAFLSALILSRRFNKPIMQLRDNVNYISMNRYDKIKPCDTKASELKELSDDINELAVQIQGEEDMRKRLSDDIVHELKTPISVLSTNIEAIMDGIYKADEERMSVLLSQTNRLARLVNNLSDLTLLETENKKNPMDKVDISNILESIYTVYLPAATDKSIELQKDFEEELVIDGNEDRLLQVFINIVSNSMKYTDEGGKIIMRGYSKNNQIICEIEDTGIGINEKDLPFIFNRFYRGDESRSRETGGSGIGLAIAKAVVSAHDGEIEIKSKQGEGTRISIIFKKANETS